MLEQKWYTVADVAALTGLTDRTIRNYLKEGTLHGKKVGVQWRFTQQDIESLFREADVTEPFTELLDELVSVNPSSSIAITMSSRMVYS